MLEEVHCTHERLVWYGRAEVRRQMRHLKSQDLKTGSACAAVLRLPVAPYQTLLQLAELGEVALVSVLTSVPRRLIQRARCAHRLAEKRPRGELRHEACACSPGVSARTQVWGTRT